MQPVFSSGVLERIGAADSLLAFDFDGTLAPIVGDPAMAAMRSSTRHLLAEAARAYPCAVISGRPEEDVLRLLGGVTVWYVIGNRALQPPEDVARLTRQVSAWRPVLVEQLAPFHGIAIEDKGVSLAVHYRHAKEHDQAHAAIARAVRVLDGVRVIEGKEVINLLPQQAPSKGTAVDRIRTQLQARETLYVGDDRTDEDVFALDGITGVRIGGEGPSAARYCLKDQAGIDDLLEHLIELRPSRITRWTEEKRSARSR